MIILGTARCPVCQQIIWNAADVVAFSWFETNRHSLSMLSDAGVHFGCLQNYTDRNELETIFMNQLGEDGIRPNGRRTQTLASSLRVSFDPRQVVIAYGPLFVTLEMPRSTALAWADSAFWEEPEQAFFLDKGLKAEYRNFPDYCELLFWLCPFGFTPNNADPSVVRPVYRRTSPAEGRKALKELQKALEFIKHEEQL